MSKYNLTDILEQYKIGSGWTSDFDYEGMLNAGLRTSLKDDIKVLKQIFEDFTDVNYHREAEHLSYAIDALEDGDAMEAEGKLSDFHAEIKKTMEGFNMDMSDDLGAFMASKMDLDEEEKKLPMDEVRIDSEVADRIEGLTNRELKRKFLFAFEDLYSDLIEEDPFHAEDVINHLNNEMHKHLSSFQNTGDKFAGMEESSDSSTKKLTKQKKIMSEATLKDAIISILKDTNATNPEVQMYVDSLTKDIKLNGKESYSDYEIDDYIEDFKNYISDKALQEHFGRFMKDYQ